MKMSTELADSLIRRLSAAAAGDTVCAKVPWRATPTLGGKSVGARLLRGTTQGMDPMSAFEVRAELATLSTLDGDPCFMDSLTVLMPGGENRTAPVNVRNTQYLAADRFCANFQWGYELETLALIDALVANDGYYIDVGANFGYFPLFLATRPGFSGRSTAFEPAPGPFSDLKRLVTNLSLSDAIEVRAFGLSDAARTARLTDDVWSGSAKIADDALGPEIELLPLDSLSLSGACFLKIDVEYHEGEMIAGAMGYLREHRPWILFEIHKDQDSDGYWKPFQILESLGYQFAFPHAEAIIEVGESFPAWIALALTVGGPPGPGAGPDFCNMLAFPAERELNAHGASERRRVRSKMPRTV